MRLDGEEWEGEGIEPGPARRAREWNRAARSDLLTALVLDLDRGGAAFVAEAAIEHLEHGSERQQNAEEDQPGVHHCSSWCEHHVAAGPAVIGTRPRSRGAFVVEC